MLDKLRYLYAWIWGRISNLSEWLIYALLFRRKGDVVSEKNISFWGKGKPKCDYHYLNDGKKKPVFIYVHGGGYVAGMRRGRRFYCYNYAKKGYFVINIDYDYAPQKRFPYQLRQIFKAIELLFDQKEKYGLDLSRIVIGGESAGACLAAHVAAITTHKELYDALNIDFKYKDFRPDALVLMNGCYDYEGMCKVKFFNMKCFVRSYYGVGAREILKNGRIDAYKYFSPLDYIDSDYPPVMVGRGTHDGLDPESVRLIERLKEKNVPHAQFMARGLVGNHAFCIATQTKEGKRCLAEPFAFLDAVTENVEEKRAV